MIAEDLLERGLAAAADDYDVPDEPVDRLRQLLAPRDADAEPPRRRWHRPSPGQWMALAAASIVVLIAVAFAVGGSNGTTGRGDEGGGSASNGAVAAGAVKAPAVHAAAGGATAGTGAPAGVPADAGSTSAGGGAGGTAEAQLALTAPAARQPRAYDSTTSVPPAPADNAKVVKTGMLDLQVPRGKVDATVNRLTALARFEGGYVQDSSSSEGSGAPSGQVTLRVPVGSFEDAVNRAKGYATGPGAKVLSLQTSGEDVTSKYVDLQQRIKALSATRRTFLTILGRAHSIGATLEVEQQISDVQTQIEQLQGQLKVLRDETSFSTLTVTVDQKVAPAPPRHHRSGFAKAVDRSASRFVRGVEVLVGLIGPLLLVLLVAALGYGGARLSYRLLRRRMV